MSDVPPISLRHAFQAGYAQLKNRLTRHLGSTELAAEALHETWLRLQRMDEGATVENPFAYVYRAALNTAFNLQKSERRKQRGRDDAYYLEEPDRAPGPDQILEGREQWQVVLNAISETTPRQQEVFRLTFTENVSLSELAMNFGVSERTIQSDLYHAINHCRKRLQKSSFANKPPRLSEG
jgi:RNA polymerase sigma-70 factor (ECF subfamily)